MKMRGAVLLAGLLVAGGSAAADPYTSGLYTVIGYSGAFPNYHTPSNVSFPSLPSRLDGVEADIGWRFNRFYSIEASYNYYTGQKTVPGQSLTQTLQNGSIDALGYLPLGYSSPWALYSDIGATYYFANAHTATISGNDSRFGWRAGGGVQVMIDDNLGVRVGGRYEWIDIPALRTLPALRSAEVFTVGLVWQQ